jgi:hypothetical protein
MAGSDSDYESRNACREHFLFLPRVARGKSLFPDLGTDRWQTFIRPQLLPGADLP